MRDHAKDEGKREKNAEKGEKAWNEKVQRDARGENTGGKLDDDKRAK
jgi:hypothetical protein